MKMDKVLWFLMFLTIICLMSGCAGKTEASESPDLVLSISETEVLPYNDLNEVPNLDSFHDALQAVASDLEIGKIDVLSYLRLNENKNPMECTISFDYDGKLVMGTLKYENDEWHAVSVVDAKTAESYWGEEWKH